MMRGAQCAGLPAPRTTNHEPRTTTHSAFTLIEIMIVVGIMAVIMAIGIPSIVQQMHKDSMRQALKDISDACMEARQRAIMSGKTTEVRFRPRERTINVIEGSSGADSGGPSYGFHGEDIVEKPAGGGEIFSAKLSERILIFYAEVNSEINLQDRPEFTCLFKPNGTCDLMGLVLRSDTGEGRKLFTDEVTGMIDWEVVP
jgi:prepilin-type N-terminal cleavage/methylation domain-containing protein